MFTGESKKRPTVSLRGKSREEDRGEFLRRARVRDGGAERLRCLVLPCSPLLLSWTMFHSTRPDCGRVLRGEKSLGLQSFNLSTVSVSRADNTCTLEHHVSETTALVPWLVLFRASREMKTSLRLSLFH